MSQKMENTELIGYENFENYKLEKMKSILKQIENLIQKFFLNEETPISNQISSCKKAK